MISAQEAGYLVSDVAQAKDISRAQGFWRDFLEAKMKSVDEA
jgi:hypothetical protein